MSSKLADIVFEIYEKGKKLPESERDKFIEQIEETMKKFPEHGEQHKQQHTEQPKVQTKVQTKKQESEENIASKIYSLYTSYFNLTPEKKKQLMNSINDLINKFKISTTESPLTSKNFTGKLLNIYKNMSPEERQKFIKSLTTLASKH